MWGSVFAVGVSFLYKRVGVEDGGEGGCLVFLLSAYGMCGLFRCRVTYVRRFLAGKYCVFLISNFRGSAGNASNSVYALAVSLVVCEGCVSSLLYSGFTSSRRLPQLICRIRDCYVNASQLHRTTASSATRCHRVGVTSKRRTSDFLALCQCFVRRNYDGERDSHPLYGGPLTFCRYRGDYNGLILDRDCGSIRVLVCRIGDVYSQLFRHSSVNGDKGEIGALGAQVGGEVYRANHARHLCTVCLSE